MESAVEGVSENVECRELSVESFYGEGAFWTIGF